MSNHSFGRSIAGYVSTLSVATNQQIRFPLHLVLFTVSDFSQSREGVHQGYVFIPSIFIVFGCMRVHNKKN